MLAFLELADRGTARRLPAAVFSVELGKPGKAFSPHALASRPPHSFATAFPSIARALVLLGLVVGSHAAALAFILNARTTAPPLVVEKPLLISLIEERPAGVVEAKPLPVAPPPPAVRPVPVRPKPVPVKTPKMPPPALETTTSPEPAPAAAPLVAPVEEKAPLTTVDGSSGTSRTIGRGQQGQGDGPLVDARFDADYLQNPAPAYPPLSRRLGEEGRVILRVRVSPEGLAETVDVKTPSGSARLDDAARRTVRHWKFIPAKRGDRAVESWVLVPILFKLES